MSTSLQGHLLVATPELRDPNFLHTVVLMVQHTDEGALGLVLNRPTPAVVKDVWSQVSLVPCYSEERLYVGGPVNGPLMAIHAFEPASEAVVLPGVFFTSGRHQLEQLVAQDVPMRFFAGFSGWGAGQLENELAEGSWHTLAAEPHHVWSAVDDLWQRASNDIASAKVYGALKIKHVPPYPWMN